MWGMDSAVKHPLASPVCRSASPASTAAARPTKLPHTIHAPAHLPREACQPRENRVVRQRQLHRYHAKDVGVR